MNIFDVVAGNKKLNEEHVSSVLAWLLDPRQTHGCGTVFLRRFLKLLDEDTTKFEKHLGAEGQMVAKGQQSKNSIEVLLEYSVVTASNESRYIDIVIFLRNENQTHVIIVENKILSASAKKTQPTEQVEGLKLDPELPENAIISYIYLTPEITTLTQEAFASLDHVNDVCFKKHLEWQNKTKNSIRDLLITSLEDESKGLMNPMAYETRFVIKSFIQFISNDFTPPSIRKETGGKCSDGTIKGLDATLDYCLKHKVYIGFTGGKKSLQQYPLEKLRSRPFKYNASLEEKNLIKRNWIKGDDFFEIIQGMGWQETDLSQAG